jgi:hypothetical protein
VNYTYKFKGLEPSTSYAVTAIRDDALDVFTPAVTTVTSDASGNAQFTSKVSGSSLELNGYKLKLEATSLGHVYTTEKKVVYNIAGGSDFCTIKTQQNLSTFGGLTVTGIRPIYGALPTPSQPWVPGDTITDVGIGWAQVVGQTDTLVVALNTLAPVYNSLRTVGQTVQLQGAGFTLSARVVA